MKIISLKQQIKQLNTKIKVDKAKLDHNYAVIKHALLTPAGILTTTIGAFGLTFLIVSKKYPPFNFYLKKTVVKIGDKFFKLKRLFDILMLLPIFSQYAFFEKLFKLFHKSKTKIPQQLPHNLPN